MSLAVPSLEATTRIAARALRVPPETLARSLAPARPDQLDELVSLRRAVFSDQIAWDDRQYLAWRYGLTGKSESGSCLHVLTHDGQVIGTIGTESLLLCHRDREYRAQRIMDLVVARAMSNAGLGIWLTQVMFAQAPVTIAVGATDESKRILDRLYLPLPPLKIAAHLIRSRELLRKVVPPVVPAGAAAWVVDAGMAAIRATRARQRRSPLRVELTNEFPGDEDYFRSLNHGRAADHIVAVRSRSFLEDRATKNTRCRMTIATVRRGRRLVGHALWYVRQSDGANGRDLHVVSCDALGADREEAIVQLLSVAAHAAESGECSRAWLSIQTDDLLRIAGRAGFWQLRGNHQQPAGVQFSDAACRTELQGGTWSLSDLENDIDAG